jgi:hypothetical protein
LNFPAAHAVHVPPFSPVKPAAHLQSACASLAAELSALAGQLVHAASPGASLKVFAPQGAHALPSGPV